MSNENKSEEISTATSTSAPVEKPDIGLLFLSNFVHQVVNPMNGVIGTLSNITDGTYSKGVVEQKINASRAQLEQCVSLIRNLAYMSDYFFKEESSEIRSASASAAETVLPQAIIESVQFFQIAAERKKIGLELMDSRTQYRVKARSELIKQVFINLFDNWLKYGRSDQIVRVTPTVTTAGVLVITVAGASIGFDGSDSELLFELGFRSPQARKVVAQGSGIGLFICRKILVNAVDGNIQAEHNKRSGITTFRLTIPNNKWHI